MASYQALIAAASEVGDLETASICEQIMREDQAMADRIQQSLPRIVTERMQGSPGARAGKGRRARARPLVFREP